MYQRHPQQILVWYKHGISDKPTNIVSLIFFLLTPSWLQLLYSRQYSVVCSELRFGWMNVHSPRLTYAM